MDAFDLRRKLIADYEPYMRGFINIRDTRISEKVDQELRDGLLWPDPLIQLNPSFEMGEWIDELIAQRTLHEGCAKIFRAKSTQTDSGMPMRLYRHQAEAVRAARTGENYVLTTGTGSGKSLSYIVPIVDHVLRNGPGKGVQAIVVYPMNALANSQAGELNKFVNFGFPDGNGPISFKRYTGQESDQERQAIIANPPDIILTNYVMLELILTRPYEKQLVQAAAGLKFLVLDELHTYRGRQGADVAILLRRLKDRLKAEKLQFVGTSATLSSSGSFDDQRKEIATVATRIFGSKVDPENVIGETLKRATPEPDINDSAYLSVLTDRVNDHSFIPSTDFVTFTQDPLAAWIEGTFGIATDEDSGRLVRRKPRSVSGSNGAASELAQLTGIAEDRCSAAIQECLLAGYRCSPSPETGLRPFAFRLHQFISRGDTVYTSLEENSERYITLNGQLRAPGREGVLLFPLVFCRECGHEYYIVRKTRDETGQERFEAREFDDKEPIGENGYVYYSDKDPWPLDLDGIISNLPEPWIEEHRGVLRIKRNYQDKTPRHFKVKSDGCLSADGLDAHFVPMPFNFCLCCGVTYGSRQRQDFSKLGTLGSEGRSTATTIICLSSILNLRKEESLPDKARKLLSFTDNRQDASLQSGHFNDFIETSLIRAAIYAAVSPAGDRGLSADELPFKVFDALDLPLNLYAADPTVRDYAARDFKKVFRDVLTYRIYRDLKRGWRILSPNLEQCGLLSICYDPLDELSGDQEVWQNLHPALSLASAETRRAVAISFLDYLRRGLAIKVDFLDQDFQERLQQQSGQRLIEPWAIDLNERMEHAAIAFPRSRENGDYAGNIFLSARGRVGSYLRLPSTFPHLDQRLTVQDAQMITEELLDALRQAGIVEVAQQPRNSDDTPGYQIRADAMRWVAGQGTTSFHDPLRVPRKSRESTAPNPYFIRFYRELALETKGISAREHTAQVQADKREEREKLFREGLLKVMFCSPTMELGVDISDLNMVNLRNVPPTPANYAQRSGRAGRSGQPALVATYCASGNAHDQYFFRRPHLMVSGAVQPPRIDLSNEDLIRSHVQAIWLAEAGIDLGRSLKDILDINGEDPSLALIQSVKDKVADDRIRGRARDHALRVITPIMGELLNTDWYHDSWLDQVLSLQIEREFERCCDRWRSLYNAALKQARAQDRVIRDPNRSIDDKNKAKRLRAEAESQLKLLTESSSAMQSDFYSYRYFASEGLLPGYNFPRLPLSAYIAGSNRASAKDEYVSRPRFLAISEFGPRSLVYHEGARYEINRVILPVAGDEELVTRQVKLCPACGYLHHQRDVCDTCELCGTELGEPLRQLFRMENVSTRRRDKITSDEEERRRIGYELHTAVRFADRGAGPTFTHAGIESADGAFAELRYGQAATIWRINYGWRQRKQEEIGFRLDLERGYWATRPDDEENNDESMSRRVERVIPFVEDRKNSLIITLKPPFTAQVMASLQTALKNAIQVCYQLEDNELAAEPLPNVKDRRHILFYEAAEGGAGVLRHLASDPDALACVANTALEICHFDPETGDDRHRAPGATEDCVTACYNCLLSYSNQLEHQYLDRHAIRDFLLKLRTTRVTSSPVERPRDTHLQELYRLCGSTLEKRWIEFIDQGGFRLPNRAQVLIEECGTRPDFIYDVPYKAAIYVDGPPHDYPERQERDRMQVDALEDRGYIVIRFHHEANWEESVRQYPNIFGGVR